MVLSNPEIATFFDALADLLEIQGENPFKIRAYRNATRTIENLGTDIIKMAKEAGIKFALNTDAHNSASLHYMPYAVFQARRGWLGKEDVINTHSLTALQKVLCRS